MVAKLRGITTRDQASVNRPPPSCSDALASGCFIGGDLSVAVNAQRGISVNGWEVCRCAHWLIDRGGGWTRFSIMLELQALDPAANR